MKTLLAAIAFIIATYFFLEMYTLNQEVRSLQSIVAELQSEQRPLIIVRSKYPVIYASPKEAMVGDD